MIILNFGHPLTAAHQERIEELTGQPIDRVVEVPTEFDHGQSFCEQIEAVVGEIDLSPAEWQTQPLLINPPGHSIIAETLLAHLHGRMGYFPTVIRLRPKESTTPPAFDVAEVIDLQRVREAGRKRR